MTDVRQLLEKLSQFPKDDLVRELVGALCRAAELAEALKPFAAVAEHDIGADESDEDLFKPMSRHNRAPLLRVRDLRNSLAAVKGGPDHG
jgi:hypothetical protein